MRPLYSCLFISVVVHGLIFSITPAKPETKAVRLEEIRLDEKKPIRLVTLSPPRHVSPLSTPSPRQERERPFQKKTEKAAPKVDTQRAEASERGRLHPAPPVEGATQAPMIEQPPLPVKERVETPEPVVEERVERPAPMEEVKTLEEKLVERPETEVVGLGSEPAAEASSLEASPVVENISEPQFPPSEVGDAPQTASISTPTKEGLSHPAIDGIRDDYLSRLREKIEAVRRYPDRAQRMGQEGRVVV